MALGMPAHRQPYCMQHIQSCTFHLQHSLQRITEALLDQNVSSLLVAGRLENVVWDQQRGLASFLLTGDQERVEQLLRDRGAFPCVPDTAGTSSRRRVA